MTSNHHAPYVLGYTRATMGVTTGSKLATASQTREGAVGTDCGLKLAYMKLELLGSASQEGGVSTFPGLGHAARHTMGGGGTRSE